MTQRPITAAEQGSVRVVIVTLDSHLAGAVDRARRQLERAIPGLRFSLHAAADWEHDAASLQRCRDDIAQGDIIIACMLFMEDHIRAILPDLQARRESCDAMIGCLSAGAFDKWDSAAHFERNGDKVA